MIEQIENTVTRSYDLFKWWHNSAPNKINYANRQHDYLNMREKTCNLFQPRHFCSYWIHSMYNYKYYVERIETFKRLSYEVGNTSYTEKFFSQSDGVLQSRDFCSPPPPRRVTTGWTPRSWTLTPGRRWPVTTWSCPPPSPPAAASYVASSVKNKAHVSSGRWPFFLNCCLDYKKGIFQWLL